MNFDSWILFSDAKAQQRLVDIAQRIGLRYAVDDAKHFQFCDAETLEKGKAHPAILVLDEEFGREWIALQMDSSDDLQRCLTDLKNLNIRHLIETTDIGRYIIVDRFQCPAEWRGNQV